MIDNDRLFDKIISQEIINIVLNSSVIICDSEKKNENSVDTCNKCLELEAELVKKNNVYIELSKWFSNLEQHCISLEVAKQLNKQIFQKDKSSDNQNHPEIQGYFEQNDLKAQLPSEKLVVVTPKNKDKKVRFADPVTSSSNTQKQVDSHKPKDSNQPLLHSTRVIGSIGVSGSKPTGNIKNNRILQSSSSNKTNKVEDQSRSIKSRKNKKNRIAKTICNAYVMQSMLNANSKSVCAICNECLFDANHDKCVLDYVHDVNVLSKSKPAKRKTKKQIWKPTGKVYTKIGYKWKPTGRTFTIVRNKCPLTRFTSTKVVPLKETTIKSVLTPTQGIKVVQIVLWVYYVEGLGHNLFSVGQFYDSDLEVAFRNHTCFVRNLEGVDLLSGSRGNNLYTLSIGNMMKSSPICLLSKASKTKSWLWHQCLSHLNFGTINQLAKQGLVRGLPKLKFEKDHLCSACLLGKSKKHSHKPKFEDTNHEKLYLMHMDLYGLMRVESINGKKYNLVIVDDYSRFTWVKFLRSKDEALEFIIKFLKMIQVRLNATVRHICTDNRTKFVIQTLRIY
ncbi:retrovirus-related pol polyprotein from transposon TNT 1-94 [Tanacetum coccineum]